MPNLHSLPPLSIFLYPFLRSRIPPPAKDTTPAHSRPPCTRLRQNLSSAAHDRFHQPGSAIRPLGLSAWDSDVTPLPRRHRPRSFEPVALQAQVLHRMSVAAVHAMITRSSIRDQRDSDHQHLEHRIWRSSPRPASRLRFDKPIGDGGSSSSRHSGRLPLICGVEPPPELVVAPQLLGPGVDLLDPARPIQEGN
jgi:hypothetical protein